MCVRKRLRRSERKTNNFIHTPHDNWYWSGWIIFEICEPLWSFFIVPLGSERFLLPIEWTDYSTKRYLPLQLDLFKVRIVWRPGVCTIWIWIFHFGKHWEQITKPVYLNFDGNSSRFRLINSHCIDVDSIKNQMPFWNHSIRMTYINMRTYTAIHRAFTSVAFVSKKRFDSPKQTPIVFTWQHSVRLWIVSIFAHSQSVIWHLTPCGRDRAT